MTIDGNKDRHLQHTFSIEQAKINKINKKKGKHIEPLDSISILAPKYNLYDL